MLELWLRSADRAPNLESCSSYVGWKDVIRALREALHRASRYVTSALCCHNCCFYSCSGISYYCYDCAAGWCSDVEVVATVAARCCCPFRGPRVDDDRRVCILQRERASQRSRLCCIFKSSKIEIKDKNIIKINSPVFVLTDRRWSEDCGVWFAGQYQVLFAFAQF